MALPSYEVEFIPLERRYTDRRTASPDAPLPPGLTQDRRRKTERRASARPESNHDFSTPPETPPVPRITLVPQ
jgi:hypothetical protein